MYYWPRQLENGDHPVRPKTARRVAEAEPLAELQRAA
jgi:hypothetical protein